MGKNQAKQGGKKKGRNSRACQAYAGERRRDKSRVRRLRRHLRNHPADVSAVQGIKKWAGGLFMKPETFHELQHVNWSIKEISS